MLKNCVPPNSHIETKSLMSLCYTLVVWGFRVRLSYSIPTFMNGIIDFIEETPGYAFAISLKGRHDE